MVMCKSQYLIKGNFPIILILFLPNLNIVNSLKRCDEECFI